MLTIGSLFAGIGGLELGLEWAGLGPTLWQVEINPMCRAVLARHWPEAERHEDVRRVGAATLAPVDLVCGGFPCQDVSSAGKRAGLGGARSGLWYEFARILAECRPRWVVIENVRSGAIKWVDAVRRDLERLGYASLPVPIAASDCGAPHERARIFLVGRRQAADAARSRRAQGPERRAQQPNAACSAADADHQEQPPAAEHDGRAREPAVKSAPSSDAHREQLRDESGRRSGPRGQSATESARARPDADGEGQLQPRRVEREGGRWPCDADRCWTTEPAVARVAHGIPGRMDRERALGNSVVPQCAQVIGHVIRQLMEVSP